MTDTEIKVVTAEEGLKEAYDGSYYFINTGIPEDGVDQYVEGYHGLLSEHEAGRPEFWVTTTGAEINNFAFPEGWRSDWNECFPPNLKFLMFTLDGTNAKLPLFKLMAGDRWFDDVVDNMRRR